MTDVRSLVSEGPDVLGACLLPPGGEQLGDRTPEKRMTPVRGNFRKRNQNKSALRHPGVGDFETFGGDHLRTVEQEIKVQDSRTLRNDSRPPRVLLDEMQDIEKGFRFKRGRGEADRIDEVGLGDGTHRSTSMKGTQTRLEDSGRVCEAPHSRLKLVGGVSLIRPQSDRYRDPFHAFPTALSALTAPETAARFRRRIP